MSRLSQEERVARAGKYGGPPARLLADLPQLGFAVIALLLLVNLAVVGQRLEDNREASPAFAAPSAGPTASASAAPDDLDVFGSPETGPLPGTAVPAYLVRRKAELAHRVMVEPGNQAVAVVSFTTAQKPAAVAALLAGRGVFDVLIRVAVKGKITDAGVLPIKGTLAPALSKGITALIASLSSDAAANTNQGDTTTNLQIPNNAAQKQAFYDEAATEDSELTVLRAGGPSIYGAVVTGSYADLGVLATMPGVRLVDPADDNVTATAVVPHALTPDDTKTVAQFETLEGLRAP